MQYVLGRILRGLIDDEFTSIDEIEEITGRSSSTVYRWMNDESEPYFSDIRRLIRQMKHPEASREMIQRLSADLPLTIEWMEEQDIGDIAQAEDGLAGHEVLDRALLALDCVTHALSEGNDAIRAQRLSPDGYNSILIKLNDAIRYLAASRRLVERYKPAD